MRKERWIAISILGICILAIFIGIYLIFTEKPLIPRRPFDLMEGVGVVRIYGPITIEDNMGFGRRGVDRIVRVLKVMEKDPRIKAVVLRINSSGGSVAAAQELYQAIKRLRTTGKPVVASMGDITTSGAYYVACGAQKIVSNPGTITGNIGVIMAIPNMKELLGKFGMKMEVIKKGEHKDIGAFFKDMSQEERALLERVVVDAYDQFYRTVLSARGLEEERMKALADGRIFTGKQAKEVGLVDEIGGFEDAVKIAAKLAGLKEEPRIYYEEEIVPFWMLLKDLWTNLFENPLDGIWKKDTFRLEYRYIPELRIE